MTDTPTPLRDPAFMHAFLDLIIPPSADGKMPGAGSLGLAVEVAAALEADAMVGPLVQNGLQAVRDAAVTRHPSGLAALSPAAGVEVIESQLAAHPWLIMALGRYLYVAYYQHFRVLEGLGEPPRAPFPQGYDIEATDPQLLDKLRSRARDV